MRQTRALNECVISLGLRVPLIGLVMKRNSAWKHEQDHEKTKKSHSFFITIGLHSNSVLCMRCPITSTGLVTNQSSRHELFVHLAQVRSMRTCQPLRINSDCLFWFPDEKRVKSRPVESCKTVTNCLLEHPGSSGPANHSRRSRRPHENQPLIL